MLKRFAWSCAIALASGAIPAAHAASDAELAEIRAQIRDLKDQYEARIKALEDRLKAAEARAAAPAPAALAVAPARAAPLPQASSASGSTGLAAFNPAVSAVLQGRYANLSEDPSRFRIAGFAPGGETGPGRRGFGLSESELAIFANVDPLFSGTLIFSLSPEDTVSVEEAYGIYNRAPFGIVPKFGRFLSGIGYLNSQHQHVWDFVDAPLAYQAFLGGQHANDGLQLTWVAPTEHYIELGAEIGNGDNFPGTPRNRNGVGSGALFARTGGDIGFSNNWQVGLSYLRTNADDRPFPQTDVFGNEESLGFTGRSHVANANFVWKYAPHGDPHVTNFKLQGEYFWRRESGSTTLEAAGLGLASNARYASRQNGWYLQGVYQFMPLWRVGLRYDRLDPGHVDFGANSGFFPGASFDPHRSTAMIDWSPSEFSRLRLQFARAHTAPELTDNEWFLQYILSIGAHGAHTY